MHPILFEIGGITIYSYGVMISLGILVATLALLREAPRAKIEPDYILEAIITAAVSGLIFARLLYVALNWEFFSNRPLEILFARFEGLSFFGGFFGGALAVYLWSRWRKIDFAGFADLLAPYLALGYAFGRIGCFLNGCCYGIETSVPWAMRASMVDSALRHPVQLYALIGAVLIFVLLKVYRPAYYFAGFKLFGLFALYGLMRFAVEFFREEAALWLGLSVAQLFSLVLFAVSTAVILGFTFRERRAALALQEQQKKKKKKRKRK